MKIRNPEFVLISLFLPVIGFGIYPDLVLSLSVDKVEAILSNFFIDSFNE